jgi:hypothetical protein
MTEVLVRWLASQILHYASRMSNPKVSARLQTDLIVVNKSSTGDTSPEMDPCTGYTSGVSNLVLPCLDDGAISLA